MKRNKPKKNFIPINYCPHSGYPSPQTKHKLKKINLLISNCKNIKLEYKASLLRHFKNLIFNDNSSKIIILLILKKLNKKNKRKLSKLLRSILEKEEL